MKCLAALMVLEAICEYLEKDGYEAEIVLFVEVLGSTHVFVKFVFVNCCEDF